MLSASLRKRARRGQKSKSFCDGKSKQSGTWSRKRRRRGQAEFGTGRMGAQRGAARTQRRHPSSRRRPPVRARRPGGHAGPAGAGVRGPAGSSGGDRRRLLGRRASKQSMPERGVRARCGAAKAPGGPCEGRVLVWSGTHFSRAWASEGTVEPLPLAYMLQTCPDRGHAPVRLAVSSVTP